MSVKDAPPELLVVEDDCAMGSLLCRIIKPLGYPPLLVATGEAAVAISRSREFAAIVLDLRLPGMDGLQVARNLRTAGLRTPIVMVSVNRSSKDELAGFEAGADDYIGKPFDVAVFIARLSRAIDRTDGTIIRVGDLTLDLGRMSASSGGTALPLTPTEVQLLRVLIEHVDSPVSLPQLAVLVWGDRELRESNTYYVTLHRLRCKLRLFACCAEIRSIRGAGYVLSMDPRTTPRARLPECR